MLRNNMRRKRRAKEERPLKNNTELIMQARLFYFLDVKFKDRYSPLLSLRA